jgi:hypothetical protein
MMIFDGNIMTYYGYTMIFWKGIYIYIHIGTMNSEIFPLAHLGKLQRYNWDILSGPPLKSNEDTIWVDYSDLTAT